MAVSIEAIDALFADTLLGVNAIADTLKLDAYEVAVYLKMRYTPDQLVERGRKVLAEDSHPVYGKVSYVNDYKRVAKPKWYVGSPNSRFVALHILLVCENLGLLRLPRGSLVLHRDGNQHNNDIENLQLVTRSEAANIFKQKRNAAFTQG